MIPRNRALVPVRRRRHHWVPVSEQGIAKPFDLGSFRRIGRMLAPAIGRWLGLPKPVLDELEKVAFSEFFAVVQDGEFPLTGDDKT